MSLPKKYLIIFVLLLIFSGILGYALGAHFSLGDPNESVKASVSISQSDRRNVRKLEEADFKLYWQVWDLIKQGYYKQPVEEADLFYGSLRGLVSGLNDPYSVFLDPPSAEEFNDELSGNFEGIGAEIGIKEEQLTIIAPLKESPASIAGLLPGDRILAVDGLDTIFMTIDQAVRLIRGEKGTEVILTVVGSDAPLSEYRDVSIIRDVIHVESVTLERLENDVFLVSISNFNEDTRNLFAQIAREIITADRVNGIILDMRNNPGGFLDTAVKIAGYWTGNRVVVLEQFSSGQQNEYQAGVTPTLSSYPTVVLINEGSASASEIVAGALSDYNLATLIGETTFGKGTVQTLESLPDGSFIKYTIAEWLTPLGNSIEEVGVDPTIVVEQTLEDFQEDRDPQLDEAIEYLTNL